MASAQVVIKLSPEQFNLVMECLQGEREAQEDLVNDPAVKEEDKQYAGQRMWVIDALINQIK